MQHRCVGNLGPIQRKTTPCLCNNIDWVAHQQSFYPAMHNMQIVTSSGTDEKMEQKDETV